MSELSSKFTREDIETLIEAMGDWEAIGNSEYHVLNMIKNLPMPAEDHESYDVVLQIKEHFRKREREINAGRVVRQEKAIFLKAKLMLARKDLGINTLFDMAASAEPDRVGETPHESGSVGMVMTADSDGVAIPIRSGDPDLVQRLEQAEFFIRDLGVWDHYQKFLAEKSA